MNKQSDTHLDTLLTTGEKSESEQTFSLRLCICVCLQYLVDGRIPGAEVRGGCELLNMGDGN